MSKDLTNDLLLQIQEQQQLDSRTLHEMKGNLDVRVKKLEDSQRYNWWTTYVITPVLMLATAVARNFGVKL